jgi:hypothetical protein
MLKRLKQLDAAALLGQLPRTMDFITCPCYSFYALWDKDGHGTNMAALTDAQPGLMRHVKTLVDEEDQSVDFVLECANGTVNASITVKVYVAWDSEYITHIFVENIKVS